MGNAWNPLGNLVDSAQKQRSGQFCACGAVLEAPFRGGIDTRRHIPLTLGMNERLGTAVELFALAAFIAAILIVVMMSLSFISDRCTRGAPFLPAVFPCFEGR